MWQGGMHGRGHAWQGGMHGRGTCVAAGGHVWQQWGMHGRGACHAGGMHARGAMHGRGHAWQGDMHGMVVHGRGGFMAEGGVRGMLSISGRYVSYLFKLVYLVKFIPLNQDLS